MLVLPVLRRLTDTMHEISTDHARLAHDVAQSVTIELAHAIEHEEATATFYRGLANTTPIAALKQTFAALAREEESPVARLEAFVVIGVDVRRVL